MASKNKNKMVANVILLGLLGATAYFGYKALAGQGQQQSAPTTPANHPQTQPTPPPNGNNGSSGNNAGSGNSGGGGNSGNNSGGSNAGSGGGYAGCKPCLNKKIKLHSKGCEVYQLQKYLNTNYNSGLVADGDWGNNTQSAVYANLFDKLDDNGALAFNQLGWANWAASWVASC